MDLAAVSPTHSLVAPESGKGAEVGRELALKAETPRERDPPLQSCSLILDRQRIVRVRGSYHSGVHYRLA
jgi:hypothetical protein